ncbi:unnamed protein product [Ceutorhynchus assimilis]|uniref:phospholipase A2 n=1 Tax=Ceutorhynchus assimilis TaxID=467358 RepID=A0A9N9MMQ6_9CUCU|nr:unnamed protein product [Ceutorhynchus assimilis]
MTQALLLSLLLVKYVFAYKIIWDNDAQVDLNEIDEEFLNLGDPRMPNLFIYPGENNNMKNLGNQPRITELIENTVSHISEYSWKTSEGKILKLFVCEEEGTKWCGPGNRAKSYDDLGPARRSDFCCRDHDHCPEFIRAGESGFGLNNTGLFIRLHCDCDEAFYNCLKSSKSLTSWQLGNIYFNSRPKSICFKKDYPIISCNSFIKVGLNYRCLDYILDPTNPKKYQWFDHPKY